MEHGEIVAALTSAFNKAEMGRIVRTYFNTNLDTLVGGESFEAVVGNLVEWAQRRGELRRLVQVSFAENPGNPKLREVFLSDHWKESEGGYRKRIASNSGEGITLNNEQVVDLIRSNARMEALLHSMDERLQRVEAELRLRPQGGGNSRYSEYIFYMAFFAMLATLLVLGWRAF